VRVGVLACLLVGFADRVCARDAGRLAVAFDLSPQVTNHHVGVTAFGNFEQRLDNDWGLDARVRQEVEKTLTAAGIDYVIVDSSDRAGVLGPGCFGGWSGAMKKECAARFSALLDRIGAHRLLDVATGAGSFRAVGPTPAYGMGLFTRGTERPNMAIPYVFLYFQLYDAKGKSVGLSNPHHCGVGKDENRSPWSRTIDAQTIEDLAWLRPILERMIEVNVVNAVARLKLVKRPAPKCTRFDLPVDPMKIRLDE
jgi:hypothetical protein